MNKHIVMSVIAGLYIVVIGQLVGCADTGDDPCDPETGEECEDGREPNEVPRGGGFLPYEPEETPGPQAKLQALTTSMPDGVWLSGFIETFDTSWSITTGGFNRLKRKVAFSASSAAYHTEVANAVLAKRLWKWTCTLNGTTSASCYSSGRTVIHQCPTAKFVFPLAYDYNSPTKPAYGFGDLFTVTGNPPLAPAAMTIGKYLETDGKYYPQLACRYPIGYRELVVARKRPRI
jgi:hypothetical protein